MQVGFLALVTVVARRLAGILLSLFSAIPLAAALFAMSDELRKLVALPQPPQKPGPVAINFRRK